MADMSKVKLPDNSVYNLRDNRFIYEKSVEAAQIASFSDGANDIPLKELTLSINPVQDLHGYDSPWAGGAGKNLLDGIDPYTANPEVSTTKLIGSCELKAGTTYTVSCKQTGTITTMSRNCFAVGKTTSIWSATFGQQGLTIPSFSYTPTDTQTYYIFVWTQGTDANLTYSEFQLEEGSSATSYAPYENICPIIGVSSVNLYRTGKNLFDKNATPLQSGKFISSVTIGGSPVYTTNANYNVYKISIKPNTTYTFGLIKASQPMWATLDINNKITRSEETGGGTEGTTITFTSQSGDYWLLLSVGVKDTYKSNDILQLEIGSTASTYSAYQGNTYLIQLGDTYYGGELDIDEDGNVKFMGNRGYANLGDVNWSATSTYFYTQAFESGTYRKANGTTNIICENYKTSISADMAISGFSTSGRIRIYDSSHSLSDTDTFKSDMAGIHIVYKLATPIEIDLTPTQINSLLGSNNIWHDANGTIACTYRVNTPLVDAIKDISPEVTIDDSKTVTDQTWSSNKIASEISSATAGVIEDIIEAITPRTGTVTDQAVATFSDGADNVPMKSVTLSINPLQEGSGDPYPAGGGKNKLPPFTNGTYTQNSIKAVVKDGLITVTGQKDTASGINLTLPLSKTFTLKQNDYLHIRNSNSNASITLSFAGAGWSPAFASTNRIIQYTGVDASVTGVTIYFAGTVTEEQNFTFQPSLEVGSAVTDWTPYENIRPISGVSSVNVARTGKNLSPTQPINYTATNYGVILFWVKAGTYTASYTGGNCQFYVRTSTPTDTTITSGTEISHSTTYRNDYTFTVPSDGYYKVQLYRSSGSPWSAVDAPTNFQIEIGNQPSSYEPYNGNIYTISLGDTYYGATLDVVRGVLTVTHKFIKPTTNFTLQNGVFVSSVISDIKKSETTSETNNIIKACNMFKPSGVRYRDSVKNGMIAKVVGNNTQIACYSNTFTDVDDFNDRVISQGLLEICYELATPIEIDLTPTQINTLLGSNNIWHDGNGNTSCEYYKTGCEPIARLIGSYTDKPTFFNGTLFN